MLWDGLTVSTKVIYGTRSSWTILSMWCSSSLWLLRTGSLTIPQYLCSLCLTIGSLASIWTRPSESSGNHWTSQVSAPGLASSSSCPYPFRRWGRWSHSMSCWAVCVKDHHHGAFKQARKALAGKVAPGLKFFMVWRKTAVVTLLYKEGTGFFLP